MESTETRDYRVRVEDDTHGIYVTESTAAVIRGEANAQADEYLREAQKLWDDLDVEDVDEVKAMRFKVSLLASALDALLYLAPIPDEDDDA